MKKTLFMAAMMLFVMSSCVFAQDGDEDVIRSFYDRCVFGTEYYDSGDVVVLRRYCSEKVVKRLRDEYEYDGEGYALWVLRTNTQDSNPDGDAESIGVRAITPLGKGWYRVSYSDGGWQGCTDVRVKNGLICDFRKDKSWGK